MATYLGDDSGVFPVAIREDGTRKGVASIFDFVGRHIAATIDGPVATLTHSTVVAAARTATATGATTGTIADGTDFVTVTATDANYIIVLPTPTPGTVVSLRNGATGYELRSSAPATVAINGGVGANVESALGANVLTTCKCDTATTWVCMDQSVAGVITATEVAA